MSPRTLLAAILAVLPLVAPLAARASDPSAPPAALEPGARVRITLLARTEQPVVGTLLGLRPGAIELKDSTARTIASADIAKLELSRGMKTRTGRYARNGALILGGAGALFGVLLGRMVVDAPNADVTLGAGLGLGGALIGAGLGAIIGSGTRKEQWGKVPVP